jgi:hypothetical protein
MLKQYRMILVSLILSILLTTNPSLTAAQSTPTGAECKPFPLADFNGFPEVEGKSDRQVLWALVFPYHMPFWVNEDVKIVWRMTGSGDLSLTAQFSDGTTIKPIWGPEAHGGSNWQRPGSEWGAGFHFPKAGCWRVIAQRGNDTGEVDFLVVERQDIEF